MPHQQYGSSEPSQLCLAQSVGLSRCRHSRHGTRRTACHVTSTFLRSFARRALPRVSAHMNALTPGRSALRILIRDNELRPCSRPGLLALCIKPSDRSAPIHLLSSPGLGLISSRSLPRGLPTASLSRTKASFGLRHCLAGSPRQPAESSSSSCGPAVHFPLLSTPSHEDAVTFSYEVQT
jgi:hypothetical protein